MRTAQRKPIFDYTDFREFLKGRLRKNSKPTTVAFRFDLFPDLAGFEIPSSVLKMIMDGKRNLGIGSIDAFALALKLNREETYFFRNLVLFNQSKLAEEKQRFAHELLRSRAYRKIHPLSDAQFNFYALWYIPIVWEMAGSGLSARSKVDCRGGLARPFLRSKLERPSTNLVKLGLLIKSAGGKLVKSDKDASTSDEVSSASVANWHREMMKKAGESIDRYPREKRDISSVTVAISGKMAAKIKEKVQEFRRELIELASQDESPTTVYQINFQFFPQSAEIKKAEEECEVEGES